MLRESQSATTLINIGAKEDECKLMQTNMHRFMPISLIHWEH